MLTCKIGLHEFLRGGVELRQIRILALLFGGEDRTDILGKNFAQLDAPLVKAVDVVDEAFDSDPVLIQC